MFIGPKEVKSVEPIAEKYNDTIDLVKVTYADETVETMTKKLYDASVTPEAADLTALRGSRCTPIVQEMLQVLLSWGAPLADVSFICGSIPVSINASINTANAKLWGKNEADLNLVEIDKVLKDKVTLDDLIPPKTQPDSQAQA